MLVSQVVVGCQLSCVFEAWFCVKVEKYTVSFWSVAPRFVVDAGAVVKVRCSGSFCSLLSFSVEANVPIHVGDGSKSKLS